jgi:hypothetical protein
LPKKGLCAIGRALSGKCAADSIAGDAKKAGITSNT